MKNILLVLAAAALASCTGAQMQYRSDEATAQTAYDARVACTSAVDASPAGAAGEFLITSESDPNAVAKMAINRLATPAEGQAVMDFAVAMAPCRKIEMDAAAKIDGGLQSALTTMYLRLDQTYGAIAGRQVTIGAGNRANAEARIAGRQDISAAVEAYDARLTDAHNNEMAARQQILSQRPAPVQYGIPQQPGAPRTPGMMCFKKSEQVSGMNKICVYDCAGSAAATTVQSFELCPLSINQ